MLQPHLKSRVGRRLFVRFLVAALLPIMGLAWFAYQNVGELLLDAAHFRLTSEGKAYGMSLIEALNRRATALRSAIEGSDGQTPTDVAGVSAITRQPAAESSTSRADAVQVRFPADGAPEIIVPLAGSGQEIVAELRAAELWNNDSAPEKFCVFNAERAVLHCSSELSGIDGSIVPPADQSQNSVVGEHRINDVDYLLGFWRARYLASLNSAGFVVMVATPRELELRDLSRFRVAFMAVVIIAFALAAALSISQIRQQLQPLVRLQQSAQRLAAGDLGSRVDSAADDEFGQVGQAFDLMAGNLERKFYLLGVLSNLDHAILASSEPTVLVKTLLHETRRAVACDAVGVVTFDDAGEAQLVTTSSFGMGMDPARGARMSKAEWSEIVGGNVWSDVSTSRLPSAWHAALLDRPVGWLVAFPAHLNGQLHEVLVLAFGAAPVQTADVIDAGRSLADRLSIAAASMANQQALYHQAHYDALTGLPNRPLLRDRIEQAMGRAERSGAMIALLFIDLDGFKHVNDSLGHGKGDTLLIEQARRLRGHLRQGDTVARLGGDEFVVLVPDLAADTAYTTIDRLARELNRALAEPVELDAHHVVAPASIGIAVYPDNASTQEDLLRTADAAMYESKRRSAGGYCFFTSNISAQARDRFELTQELREATQRDEFLLYYQPKIDAATGALAGAEALLRWNSPKRGLVLPGGFVHLLDEMGLGIWLGEWVLEQACRQMQSWDAEGFAPIPVSINLSAVQFERSPVVERVQHALESHRLRADRLELEILESMAANESPSVRNGLVRLRELGVSIALDDFGTGFSSLVYLAEVPADVIKLDRVFTHSVCSEKRQQQIVELIISMARVMDLKVVAEGVENEDQRGLLSALGCNLLQGYLIGRPIAPDDFASRWLRAPGSAPTDLGGEASGPRA